MGYRCFIAIKVSRRGGVAVQLFLRHSSGYRILGPTSFVADKLLFLQNTIFDKKSAQLGVNGSQRGIVNAALAA